MKNLSIAVLALFGVFSQASARHVGISVNIDLSKDIDQQFAEQEELKAKQLEEEKKIKDKDDAISADFKKRFSAYDGLLHNDDGTL